MKTRGPRTKKSGGHAFPEGVNEPYRRHIMALPCWIAGRWITRPLSVMDRPVPGFNGCWHVCWIPDGDLRDPAHIGKHQATGAPDAARLVPLCRAAHRFYDEHRSQWARVTDRPLREMKIAAADLWREYQGPQNRG